MLQKMLTMAIGILMLKTFMAISFEIENEIPYYKFKYINAHLCHFYNISYTLLSNWTKTFKYFMKFMYVFECLVVCMLFLFRVLVSNKSNLSYFPLADIYWNMNISGNYPNTDGGDFLIRSERHFFQKFHIVSYNFRKCLFGKKWFYGEKVRVLLKFRIFLNKITISFELFWFAQVCRYKSLSMQWELDYHKRPFKGTENALWRL